MCPIFYHWAHCGNIGVVIQNVWFIIGGHILVIVEANIQNVPNFNH